MDVYDINRPIYLANKFFGLAPYHLQGRRYEVSSSDLMYSLVLTGLYIVNYGYFMIMKDNGEHSIMKDRLGLAYFAFTASSIIMILLLNLKNRKLITKSFNSIAEIDIELKCLGYDLCHKHQKWMTIVSTLFVVTSRWVSEWYICAMIFIKVDFMVSCYVVCGISFTIQSLELLNFLFCVNLLRNRFKVINTELTKLTTPASSIKVKIIQVNSHPDLMMITKMKRMHYKLCEEAKRINNYFSFAVLVLALMNFLEFTNFSYQTFGVIEEMKEGNSGYERLIVTLIFAATGLARILMLSLTCNMTKNEANKTGVILFKIESRFEEEILHEIKIFCEQILRWDLKFTAFEFFEINMSLLYTVLTTATTYLTILIQFEASSH